MVIEMPFKRLTTEHEILPFDCGDEDLNNYLALMHWTIKSNCCL